jgi:hypothetical protein
MPEQSIVKRRNHQPGQAPACPSPERIQKMIKYIVHIYREMRLSFADIEADTPAAAAVIARGKQTSDADDIEDCDGEDLSALVDVAGDEDYSQSVMIDFETERHRKTAPKLLEALKISEGLVQWTLDHGADSHAATAALTFIRSTIAEAEATGIAAEAITAELLAALEAIMPYAQSEHASLFECWKRGGESISELEAERCGSAIDKATVAIANAKAAIIPSESKPAKPPSQFEIEHDPAENNDRVYVMVDGTFDVAIIRTDEGVVVDVYPKDGFETIATTHAFDSDVEQESSTN